MALFLCSSKNSVKPPSVLGNSFQLRLLYPLMLVRHSLRRIITGSVSRPRSVTSPDILFFEKTLLSLNIPDLLTVCSHEVLPQEALVQCFFLLLGAFSSRKGSSSSAAASCVVLSPHPHSRFALRLFSFCLVLIPRRQLNFPSSLPSPVWLLRKPQLESWNLCPGYFCVAWARWAELRARTADCSWGHLLPSSCSPAPGGHRSLRLH